MAKPAVPQYLGQDFTETPPGHRFTLYFSSWSSDEKEYQLDYEEWISRERIGKKPQPPNQHRDWMIPTKRKYIGLKESLLIDSEIRKLALAIQKRQIFIANALGEAVWSVEAPSIAPFMTGTGIEHPLENGMAFLNPYGLPYLPGSSVKGVVRRAAEELRDNVFDEGSWGWDQPAIDALFGKETESADTETERTRGVLTFWDVLPQCDRLAVDIMNPHYGEYYQGNTTPHDSGQPIPILFLTIPPKTPFIFHVQCDRACLPKDWPAARWSELLDTAFAHAFDWLGFGAKTAVGYGQFSSDALEQAKTTREETAKQRQAAEAAKKAEAEHQEKLAAMSPLDRDIEAVVEAAPKDQPRHKAILNALKQGRWSGEEMRHVAERVRDLMTRAGVWRTKSEKKKPEKDEPYQSTLTILAYLEGKK